MSGPLEVRDWHALLDERPELAAESTRDRLPWLWGLFALAFALVLARAIQLELSTGAEARLLAARPIERQHALAAARGRIVARDGAVLAEDRLANGLAVQYRYLESPPNPQWLRRQALQRLPRSERRDPRRVAQMESTVRSELSNLHFRLARLADLAPAEWNARADRIQRRVEGLAAAVDARRQERYWSEQRESPAEGELTAWQVLAGLFAPPEGLAPPKVVLVEHQVHHRLVDDLPAEAAAEIVAHPERYPGVKVSEYRQRAYPHGELAAHVVGHVSAAGRVAAPDDPSGSGQTPTPQTGLLGGELQWEPTLRGQVGLEVRTLDHRGKLLGAQTVRPPTPGNDVRLTIDARLQAAAEQLLDRALRRVHQQQSAVGRSTFGGAAIVMDVRTGELLALASAPRFDPNCFSRGGAEVEAYLNNSEKPLFDRALKMAIAPGSVFKTLTAVALLEAKAVDPRQAFRCQGYFDDPDHLRCQLFRQHGVGHGDVTLADALAQSCNVYFFHHVQALGAGQMVDHARQFGFGQPTGCELAGEATGSLPALDQLRSIESLQFLAVGQGAITATPLQIVRCYAALAAGGRLVRPRIVADAALDRSVPDSAARDATTLPLSPNTLAEIRAGLERVVADPAGTAYATVRLPGVAIAGKTGTAETGLDQLDHAWFAGYVPADEPRYALVVALEHGGSGASVAGPVAKGLVQALRHLGYIGPAPAVASDLPRD